MDSATVRTITTLFRQPGRLTREYLAGHTRRYLPPLRVFLGLFAVMIFARTVTHADLRIAREVRAKITAQQAASPDLAVIRARRASTHREMPDFAEPLARASEMALANQWLHLIDPLVVALVLALLYRARRRNYAEHVVFALHLLAFNWALSIMTTAMHSAWSARQSSTDLVSAVHWLAFGSYAYLALRYVHEESRPRTALKAAALTAGGQVAMGAVPVLTGIVAAVWTIATLK